MSRNWHFEAEEKENKMTTQWLLLYNFYTHSYVSTQTRVCFSTEDAQHQMGVLQKEKGACFISCYEITGKQLIRELEWKIK